MTAGDRWAHARAAAGRVREEVVEASPGDDAGLPMVTRLLERRGFDVLFQPATGTLLRGAWAALYPDTQLAICDRALSPERQAFTLAHEIGHLVLHTAAGTDPNFATGDLACAAADIVIDTETALAAIHAGYPLPNEVYNPRQQRELEANVFALEVLAPAARLWELFVREGLTASAIATRLRVSRAATFNALAWLLQSGLPPGAEPGLRDETGSRASSQLLDASQRAAATARGPLLVSAGPGSGKTGTLVGRVDHLVRDGGVDPRRLLVLTYSNRAAAELRGRVAEAVGMRGKAIAIATIHGFAHDVLRRYAGASDLSPAFQILDDAAALVLVRRHLPELARALGPLAETISLDRPMPALRSLLGVVSRAKDSLVGAEEFARDVAARIEADDQVRLSAVFYTWYAALCRTRDVADYGELLMRACTLLRDNAGIRAEINAAYPWLLVDEYQDINTACADFIKLLAPSSGLWAVGDPLQAIYRWRGAEPSALRYAEDAGFASGASPALCDLAVNYRSRGPIVRLCGAVAAAMHGGSVDTGRARWAPAREPGDVVARAVMVAESEHAEAEIDGIAREIREEVARGRSFADHAVLCATNAQADTLARGLASRGLPVSRAVAPENDLAVRRALCILAVAAGETDALVGLGEYRSESKGNLVPFLEVDDREREITGLTADTLLAVAREARDSGAGVPSALRAAAPSLPEDQQAAARSLAACIADVTAIRGNSTRDTGTAWDALAHYLFEGPYRAAAAAMTHPGASRALHALLVAARAYDHQPSDLREPSLPAHVRSLLAAGIGPRAEPLDAAGAEVRVMTVHAAKGLEFPVVFIPNFARGRFPSRGRSDGGAARAETEQDEGDGRELDNRSLLFVALSRARDRLIISHARTYGGRMSQPSPLAVLLEEAFVLEPPERVTWAASDCVLTTVSEAGGAAVPSANHGAVSRVSPAATIPPEVDNYALETYLDCPRRFYYQHRLGLAGAPGNSFPHFHIVLRRALARVEGAEEGWTEQAALAGLDAEWAVAHDSHPHEALYYQRARHTILASVGRHDAQSTRGTPSLYGQTYPLALPSGQVLVRIDRVDGVDAAAPVAIRLRSGRPTDDHPRETRVALYHAAMQAEFGSSAVHQEYLLTGTIDETRAWPATYQRRLDACDAALAGIAAEAFAPTQGEHCATCPYWLICPNG